MEGALNYKVNETKGESMRCQWMKPMFSGKREMVGVREEKGTEALWSFGFEFVNLMSLGHHGYLRADISQDPSSNARGWRIDFGLEYEESSLILMVKEVINSITPGMERYGRDQGYKMNIQGSVERFIITRSLHPQST